MRGTVHQRRAFNWLCLVVAFGMVVIPVGIPMPPVPGPDSMQSSPPTSAVFSITNRLGVLSEDDLEVEHSDFTIIRNVIREAPRGTPSRLISFLWTERLHRPPIA